MMTSQLDPVDHMLETMKTARFARWYDRQFKRYVEADPNGPTEEQIRAQLRAILAAVPAERVSGLKAVPSS